MNLPSIFAQASQQYAKRIALNHPDGSLTYQDIHQQALALCQDPKFSSELFQIIEGKQTITEYIQIWASFLSGKPFVPLNPKLPKERIQKILSSTRHAMTQHHAADQAADPAADPAAHPEERPTAPPESLAYILFTSGTTGEPKGVPIGCQQLANHCYNLQKIIDPHAADKVLQLFDFSFDAAIAGMLIAWASGAELCALPPAHVLMAPRYVQEQDITIWHSVPSVVSLAAKAGLLPPNALPSIRLAIFGGEALPYETVRMFSQAAPNARIMNFWGPTEGTISLSHFEIDPALLLSDRPPNADLAIMPIGRPHPGVQLALWDHQAKAFTVSSGELCACSDQLTTGYLNRPDLSEAQFFFHEGKRWYRTGDLAKWDDRYGYCYLGRIDRQIKFKGYRIELQDCEVALRQASGCDQVCVLPWPISADGSVTGLLGFIADPSVDTSKTMRTLEALLPNYMIPSQLILLDELPLNISGKIDFKALEAKASEFI